MKINECNLNKRSKIPAALMLGLQKTEEALLRPNRQIILFVVMPLNKSRNDFAQQISLDGPFPLCDTGPWPWGSSTRRWAPNPSCAGLSLAWCPSSCVSVATTLRLCPVLLRVSNWGSRNVSTSLGVADGTAPPSRTTWPYLDLCWIKVDYNK